MIIHTGYSFRHAAGDLKNVASRIKEIGWKYAPISDRASTFGWVRWTKICKGLELIPIYGVELAVTSDTAAKKPTVDFWSFFAIDDIKWVNKLVEIASNQFRYQPLLTYQQAMAADGVIKIFGHRPKLSEMSPQTNLYSSLSPALSSGAYKAISRAGYEFVATSANSYVRPEDKSLYEVICGRDAESHSYPQHILSDEEWGESLPSAPSEEVKSAALSVRDRLLGGCSAHLKRGELLKPQRPASLRDMCLDGAGKLGCDLSDPIYAERLERELALIKEKNFEDYFYIIADLVSWSRERMMVGPARGSSCGSLVCYLLEITTIDPIPYGLIFERFIDINRLDLPDIDLDFPEERRHLAFEYMNDKYGADRVARLGTVSLYKPRSAISEAGAALEIPKWKTDKVLDSLIERSGGDSRALQAMEDTFNDTPAGQELIREYPELEIAARMEGHPRHCSQHAAGIILTDNPIDEYVALDCRTGAVQCDKKDAEELNLLKIDALGLTQLSVFEEALEMAGLPLNHLFSIPLNDQESYRVLNEGRFSGIFQFNGPALKSIITQLGDIHELMDIVNITAMARPGPMASGGTNEWIKRRTGKTPVVYPHPDFEPYLNETLGIIAYQEQVMQVGREIGGLSWSDVSALRKAMSKSLGKEFFDKYGNEWKKGGIARGIKKEILDKYWDEMCAYGSMAFNKSHSVAYGYISYWCCWMKAHHPLEFAAATLQHEADPARQIQLLRELAAEGINYIPVHHALSTDRWKPGFVDGEKKLIGPLSLVKGIGPKLVSQIMSAKSRGEPLPSRAAKLLSHPVTPIDDLFPVRAAIQRLLPDPREKNIVTQPTEIKDVVVKGYDYEVLVLAVAAQIKPKDENELVNVQKRGYALTGPTRALNLRISDDTDIVFAKVNRFDFHQIGQQIVDRGLPGEAIYAIKGIVPKDFRMIQVKGVRYLGTLNEA